MKRFALVTAAAATAAFAAAAGEMVTFAELDADADGAVTEAEFVAHKTAGGEVTAEEAAEKFASIDTDADAIVTEAELTAAVDAWADDNVDADIDLEVGTESDSSY